MQPDRVISNLPHFEYAGIALAPNDLRYNPCGDVIFPSVLCTDRLTSRGGRYAMYYAPHNAPGGICLAWADDLRGPWREHPANPLFTNEWLPHHSVSHISSPHAIWVEEDQALFLYYHGENDTTRYATSRDGIHFAYGGVALDTTGCPAELSVSYARVFPAPGNAPGRYVMTFMGLRRNEWRTDILLAFSDDARNWRVRQEPFISTPAGDEHSCVCGAWYIHSGQRHLIYFHADIIDPATQEADRTDIWLAETDSAFSSARILGRAFPRTAVGPENHRVCDPCIIAHKDRLYMFHGQGSRLAQSIGWAEAPLGMINHFENAPPA